VKVYVVVLAAVDGFSVKSAWTTEEQAQAEADRLKRSNRMHYETALVVPVPLDAPGIEEP
jgi:hypothetical protein